MKLAVINQKGGTGKTTSSIHLAAALVNRGVSTLLIDNDPQGSVGTSLRLKLDASTSVLRGQESLHSAVQSPEKNFEVLTSGQSLLELEGQLHRRELSIERLFRQAFEGKTSAEHIVIDMAPSRSLLNEAALYFVDEVLIPVSCDYLALVGVRDILAFIQKISKAKGQEIRLRGILPTLYDKRSKVSKESVALLEKHFPGQIFSPIRQTTKVKEAPSYGQTLFEYAPRSSAAFDYSQFTDQLLEH